MKYTIIYQETHMCGSHRYTTVHLEHVEAESAKAALADLGASALYVFDGHLNQSER